MKEEFYNTGSKLAENGIVDQNNVNEIDKISTVYNVKAPSSYALKIKNFNNSDPIWRTIVPTSDELGKNEFEIEDPIGDTRNSPVKGLVHRYQDRVVIMPTNICDVYCRFCFRKDLVGKKGKSLNLKEINRIIEYIKENTQIWEVIISGGDPLVLSNNKLNMILNLILEINHVKIIRLHTRVPVVNPSRVDSGLIKILRKIIDNRKAVYIITHINHIQEIDIEVENACSKFIDHGIPLLNQSALLKGINDNPKILESLLRKLVEMRIKPYYLHHLDQAIGTNHFQTTIEEGQNLIKSIRGKISGLCQPTYVLDIPQGFGKVPIGPVYIRTNELGQYIVESPTGEEHVYPHL